MTIKYSNLKSLIYLSMHDAHLRLIELGLKGSIPILNLHPHTTLPPCVYQPRTNAVACSAPRLSSMIEDEIKSLVLDAMAMCGCQRRYEADMMRWNNSQNKARLPVPALALQNGPNWRLIRFKL